MLELRPNCELCDCDLPVDSAAARICSYECTFCADCVDQVLENVCPNCGGGFVARPLRPATEHRIGVSREHHPPSDKRRHSPYDRAEIRDFVKQVKQAGQRCSNATALMREGDYRQPPALLVIDVQKGLAEPSLGQRNNPQAESNMASLLAAWRERSMPVIHIRHCSTEEHSPLRAELPGNAFKDEVKPQGDEPVFSKTVNSAFIGTRLESHLRSAAIDRLVIIGLSTDHCVSASTRMASDLGFEVTLISDASAAFERIGYDGNHYTGEQIHRVNLVSLDGEFCRVHSTAEVVDSICRASHPNNDRGATR